MSGPRVLFVGQGATSVCYYRCALPALFGGWDWVGLTGVPPKVQFVTGLVDGRTEFPLMDTYDVVVLQQPRGPEWGRVIESLQEKGVKVVFEVDDYVHGIASMQDHDFREFFDRLSLASLEDNMRRCDAVICSTAFIAMRYRQFNERTFLCRNALDLGRYALTLPERPTVNIGWAGGTGHAKAALPWLTEVGTIMATHPNVAVVTIGQNFADAFRDQFPGRSISIPWTLIDTYPAAMTLMDIAIAPADDNEFFHGKSDLRWLEAGALGIPVVANPAVYPDIEDGQTGFHALSADLAGDILDELVDAPEQRRRVGEQAREHIRAERSMAVGVKQWHTAFEKITGG